MASNSGLPPCFELDEEGLAALASDDPGALSPTALSKRIPRIFGLPPEAGKPDLEDLRAGRTQILRSRAEGWRRRIARSYLLDADGAVQPRDGLGEAIAGWLSEAATPIATHLRRDDPRYETDLVYTGIVDLIHRLPDPAAAAELPSVNYSEVFAAVLPDLIHELPEAVLERAPAHRVRFFARLAGMSKELFAQLYLAGRENLFRDREGRARRVESAVKYLDRYLILSRQGRKNPLGEAELSRAAKELEELLGVYAEYFRIGCGGALESTYPFGAIGAENWRYLRWIQWWRLLTGEHPHRLKSGHWGALFADGAMYLRAHAQPSKKPLVVIGRRRSARFLTLFGEVCAALVSLEGRELNKVGRKRWKKWAPFERPNSFLGAFDIWEIGLIRELLAGLRAGCDWDQAVVRCLHPVDAIPEGAGERARELVERLETATLGSAWNRIRDRVHARNAAAKQDAAAPEDQETPADRISEQESTSERSESDDTPADRSESSGPPTKRSESGDASAVDEVTP